MEMKTIGAFIGILLIGFMIFGLVSAAGYNIVVSSSSDDSSSSTTDNVGSSSSTASVVNDTDDEAVSVDEGVSEDIGDTEIAVDGESDSFLEQFSLYIIGAIALVLVVSATIYFKKKKK